MIFIDLRKAYENFILNKLWEVIDEKSVNKTIVSVTKTLNINIKSCTKEHWLPKILKSLTKFAKVAALHLYYYMQQILLTSKQM